jgi:hypothetical protein
MKLSDHPEYLLYLQDRAHYQRCQNAFAIWKASQGTIPVAAYELEWSCARAREFTQELSSLLLAYNQVLWGSFPHCCSCLGQCCLRTGVYVAVFDLLALAWLELPFPELPERITARSFDCIYRGSSGCLWPTEWRTFKCWLFFCSGPQVPEASAGGIAARRRVARHLQPFLDDRLPAPLHLYERQRGITLSSRLEEPLAFVEALGQALLDLLVGPLAVRFPEILPVGRPPHYLDVDPERQSALLHDPNWNAFLSSLDRHLEAAPEVYAGMPAGWLEDIDLLEWIAHGRPADGASRLERLLQRYNRLCRSAPSSSPVAQIRRRISRLLQELYAASPVL